MFVCELNFKNLNSIASRMDNGVSFDELCDMVQQDKDTEKPRIFVEVDGLWAFLEEKKFATYMKAMLELMDA